MERIETLQSLYLALYFWFQLPIASIFNLDLENTRSNLREDLKFYPCFQSIVEKSEGLVSQEVRPKSFHYLELMTQIFVFKGLFSTLCFIILFHSLLKVIQQDKDKCISTGHWVTHPSIIYQIFIEHLYKHGTMLVHN